MRIVVALGGNALLKRGELESADQLGANARTAARALAEVAKDGHELVVTHGNGPQIGLLALQAEAYSEAPPFPLDVLGAESEGLIGYLIQRELANALPRHTFATLLTQVLVDAADPAFATPTKPIGPRYDREAASQLAAERGWTMVSDGDYLRRAVPSPMPRKIIEIDAIRVLVDAGTTVIAAGGGGIPVAQDENEHLYGVEAVIDKDLTSVLLASALAADCLLLLTDVDAVSVGWGEPSSRAIRSATPWQLDEFAFDAGSMGPKVQAACNFVRETQAVAGIGAITDIRAILDSRAGTTIHARSEPLTFAA